MSEPKDPKSPKPTEEAKGALESLKIREKIIHLRSTIKELINSDDEVETLVESIDGYLDGLSESHENVDLKDKKLIEIAKEIVQKSKINISEKSEIKKLVEEIEKHTNKSKLN